MDEKLKQIGERLNSYHCQESVDEIWRIKINGSYFMAPSGKTSWKTKGHAKNAFHDTFERAVFEFIPEIYELYSKEKLKELKKILEKMEEQKIIEFVKF